MVTLVERDKKQESSAEMQARALENARESGEFDKLPEFDNIPEIVREIEMEGRITKTNIKIVEAPKEPPQEKAFESSFNSMASDFPSQPKTDELETLWPGVHTHQEFLLPPASKRTPSFYIMLGFMGGAIASLIVVWGYSLFANKLTSDTQKIANNIVVAKNPNAAIAQESATVANTDPNAAVVPISNTYEIKSGDTLVMIAMKNYKKVTPRLLDEIVRVNNLKNANRLRLGEKIKLPTYTPQSSKIAASKAASVN